MIATIFTLFINLFTFTYLPCFATIFTIFPNSFISNNP